MCDRREVGLLPRGRIRYHHLAAPSPLVGVLAFARLPLSRDIDVRVV